MRSCFKCTNRFLRSFHTLAGVQLDTIVKPGLAFNETNTVSIYRVPYNLRQVEAKAYDPNVVAIGPYHRGLPHLQGMEHIKRESLERLVDLNNEHGVTQDTLFNTLQGLQDNVRACYSETTLNVSSDEFTEMLVRDGCFILELFRESMKQTSTCSPVFTTRWMLPVLRRDLIMLENQIPFFVLSSLFDVTHCSNSTNATSSLIDLAINFFNPLMRRDKDFLMKCIATSTNVPLHGGEHLLALFRSTFLPRSKIVKGEEQHMFRTISELRESGVKLKKKEGCGTLDLYFTKAGILHVPRLSFDDYTGTLLRNMVAFEQCHQSCRPDFTSFLFFINGLINTPQDVERLHYANVLQHSLGSDGELADLVNKLCREVAHDANQYYLYSLSIDLSEFCNKKSNKWRAQMKHEYISSPAAFLSVIAAVVIFLLTLVQTWFEWETYKYLRDEKKNKKGVKM